jgi:hypothetical protein
MAQRECRERLIGDITQLIVGVERVPLTVRAEEYERS